MRKLTWAQVAAWRVRRHHLDTRAPAGSLLAVAGRLCGLHAQVLSCAELTAWARIENLQRAGVQRALWDERTLVKTWAMRGTLHLLPASELPMWWAALTTNRRYLRESTWKKYFGITLDELDQVTEAIGTALKGGVMTREELVREVARISGSAAFGRKLAANSWGTILKPAAFAGHLCFGPSVGPRVRFARPDTWLPQPPQPMELDAATLAITRRFLAAYAPATPHDLARWWSGGRVVVARQWLAALDAEACEVDLEGQRAWMLAEDVTEARELPRRKSARLLPGFDQYVIGASRHAEHLLPGKLRPRVFRPQGWISPVLLVNGRMEGVWRHEMRGSRVAVEIDPFVEPAAWVRRRIDDEAERLAAFLGGAVELHWNRAK